MKRKALRDHPEFEGKMKKLDQAIYLKCQSKGKKDTQEEALKLFEYFKQEGFLVDEAKPTGKRNITIK